MTIEISIRRPCPDCGGVGVVTHPAWRELQQQSDVPLEATEEELRAFFAARGYPADRPLPDVAMTCMTCRGHGWQRDFIGLDQLARLLRDGET